MDSAHPLLRGETLAVHLYRTIRQRGSVWLHRDDAQERNTVKSSNAHVPALRRVQWAVTVDGFVCDCMMDESQEICTTGPISDIFTMIIERIVEPFEKYTFFVFLQT